jgi:hypothetical protein
LFRPRDLPIVCVVLTIGIAESLLCVLGEELLSCPFVKHVLLSRLKLATVDSLHGVVDATSAWVALIQVALAGFWLAMGRRPISWRLLATAGLILAWASLFQTSSLREPPRLLYFLASLGIVAFAGGLVGRFLGLALVEMRSGAVDVVSRDLDLDRRRWQFSIGDLFLLLAVVAVVLAPFRQGPTIERAWGDPTWRDVACLAVTAALGWSIVWSIRTTRRRRRLGWAESAFLGASALWLAVRVLCDGVGTRLAVHAAVLVLVVIGGLLGNRPSLSPACESDVDPNVGNGIGSRPNERRTSLENLLLLVLAIAWLLGPLREGLRGNRHFGISEWLFTMIFMAVPVLWTFAILWPTLTTEKKWWRWGPSLPVFVAGGIVLVFSWGWKDVPLIESVGFALLVTACSLAIVLPVRWAGYRLCFVRTRARDSGQKKRP